MFFPEVIKTADASGLNQTTLKYLSAGAYNRVYVTREVVQIGDLPPTRWVYKRPKIQSQERSHPQRALRKYKMMGVPAFLGEPDGLGVWIPYMGDKDPCDEAIAEAQVHLFREHRHIDLDACEDGNCREWVNAQGETQVKLIDVDVMMDVSGAVQSPVSVELYAWYEGMKLYAYWAQHIVKRPVTIAITEILFWLRKHLNPEEIQNDFLVCDVLRSVHHRLGFRESMQGYLSLKRNFQEIMNLEKKYEVVGSNVSKVTVDTQVPLVLSNPMIQSELEWTKNIRNRARQLLAIHQSVSCTSPSPIFSKVDYQYCLDVVAYCEGFIARLLWTSRVNASQLKIIINECCEQLGNDFRFSTSSSLQPR
jgi:hypothetical protein